MSGQTRRFEDPADHDSQTLKVCDFCGAVNHASRGECFVCGWHGHFTSDTDSVHRAESDMSAGSDTADQPRSATLARPVARETFLCGILQRLRRLFVEDG